MWALEGARGAEGGTSKAPVQTRVWWQDSFRIHREHIVTCSLQAMAPACHSRKLKNGSLESGTTETAGSCG